MHHCEVLILTVKVYQVCYARAYWAAGVTKVAELCLLIALFACRGLHAAFAAWKQALELANAKHAKMAKAAAFLTQASMASAWSAWQQLLLRRNAKKDKVSVSYSNY